MFVVLQTGGFVSYSLFENFVQIIDDATCNASYYGAITDTMICPGTYSGFIGPCYVRCL